MAYSFDGTAKTITLSSGVTSLNLIDLHSRWKDWVLSGNAGYELAFITIGGDIPAIPLYLFLKNSWRIVPQAANHTLTVSSGILEVDGGGDPFIDPVGSYKIRINRATPGIAIGYSATGSSLTLSEIESSTILAKEVTVLSRLAATDYTAPNNAGIVALPTASENAAELIAAAQITPIHSDLRKAVGVEYHGDGSEDDKLRSILIP